MRNYFKCYKIRVNKGKIPALNSNDWLNKQCVNECGLD